MTLKTQLLYFLFIFYAGLTIHPVYAQDEKAFAREIIETLAADKYYGRGYVKGGMKKTARYLKCKYKKLGAQPIAASYIQEFHHPVNTFPGKMEVTVSGHTLIPGADYIVDPESGGANITFGIKEVKTLDSLEKMASVNSFIENKMVVVFPVTENLKGDSLKKFNLIIERLKNFCSLTVLTNGKLTWSVSTEPDTKNNHVLLRMKQSAFPANASEFKINISNKFIKDFTAFNVAGLIPSQTPSDKYIVFTAHLDHLGMMGDKTVFNGANDNASGISMLLTLMRHYQKNKPDMNIAFIAFGSEEAGLIGSKYYVEHPLFPLNKIKFLVNLDLLGTGEDGITVVNATKHKEEFELLKNINEKNKYLTLVKPRGEAANSDHYWFSKNNVPAFFIYTMGGTTAYHDIYDRSEQLPLTEFEDVFKLITEFVNVLK